MKYALLIYSQSTAEEYAGIVAATRQAAGPAGPDRPAGGPWLDYTRAAREAGVLAGAEQLTHSETATSVRLTNGDRVITDGPFMETKEHLLGFYLVDVEDLDAALDWAQRMPAHPGQTIEVRAALSGLPWQRALTE
jgi:hypothetical protein